MKSTTCARLSGIVARQKRQFEQVNYNLQEQLDVRKLVNWAKDPRKAEIVRNAILEIPGTLPGELLTILAQAKQTLVMSKLRLH